MRIEQAKDFSSQRRGLLNRAFSEEYKQERLESELWVHIKPTTIARIIPSWLLRLIDIFASPYDFSLIVFD